jgi:cytochrome P450
VIGGRRPTFADAERLVYTRMTLEESLRVYPPAWGFSRLALGDDEIGGYHVPAGSIVFLIPFVVHRRPHLWPDPERFDPERFAPERVAERSRFAYFPFGGGPRQCIGNHFAMIEAQLILAMLSRRYRIEPVPGTRVSAEPLITLRPKPGIKATLRSRQSPDGT